MKPTIAVDLDGVLATYEGWKGIDNIGDPISGAVHFTQELSRFARILIYTTRCKEFLGSTPIPAEKAPDPDRRPKEELVQIVRDWLDRHGFAYDEIYSGQGKPFAVCYIDDRAVSCRPQPDTCPWAQFLFAINQAQWLISQLKPSDTSTILDEE